MLLHSDTLSHSSSYSFIFVSDPPKNQTQDLQHLKQQSTGWHVAPFRHIFRLKFLLLHLCKWPPSNDHSCTAWVWSCLSLIKSRFWEKSFISIQSYITLLHFIRDNPRITHTKVYMLNHRVVLNNRVLRLSQSNVCEVLYENSSCNIDLAKYITNTGNSCFRLGEI